MFLKQGLCYVIFIIILDITTISHAEVVLDGTLGLRGALPGPDYSISADLGQQHGENLFHSFQSFNLQYGESATFSGPLGIQNIISRVTGGHSSYIDGVLRSTIPNADLYFLNPAGVIFGPNARLDIPASLYVSTADYLKLEDGGRFDVTQPNNSLLTVAPPAAFGFLDAPIGNIAVNGSDLLVNFYKIPNKNDTLAFVGGDIEIQDGRVTSFDGHIHLVSVASEGEVPIDYSGLWTDTFAKFGTITITDSSDSNLVRIIGNIDASGFGGGQIFIRAGQLFLNQGYLFSDTYGAIDGQGIDIQVTDELRLENGSRITTQTLPLTPQPIGHAGDIHISAEQIRVTGGSQIQSSTLTYGDAGNVTVTTDNLYMAGFQTLANGDIVNSGILSNTLGPGSSGQIQITANDLELNNGGIIRTETQGPGHAGNMSILANRLTLWNGGRIDASATKDATGDSGYLTIIANDYLVIHGARQKEETNALRERASALLANRFLQGEESDITINTPVLAIADGGIIQASGRVKLNTEVDLIDNFMVLPQQHFDASELLGDRCAGLSQQDLSRFVIIIRDVFPPGPTDLKTHYLFE